jgi:hypothetical protein
LALHEEDEQLWLLRISPGEPEAEAFEPAELYPCGCCGQRV